MTVQPLTRERMERLVAKSIELANLGISWSDVEARQVLINRTGKSDPNFTEVDFNDALEDLYREKFTGVVEEPVTV